MARFPITTTQRSLPGVGTNVRMQVDAGEVGRALANLGAVTTEEASKWNRLYADTKFSETKRAASERMGRQLQEELSKASPAEYDAVYEKALNDVKQLRPKHGLAGRYYDKWVNAASPQWSNGVFTAAKNQMAADAKATLLGEFTWAKSQNNIEGARNAATKLVNSGTWSEGEAKARVFEIESDVLRETTISSLRDAKTDKEMVDILITIQDSDKFTSGQKQNFEDIAENIMTRRSENFKVLRMAEKRRLLQQANESLNTEIYTEEDQTNLQDLIVKMSGSDDKELQQAAKELASYDKVRSLPSLETDPAMYLDGVDLIADLVVSDRSDPEVLDAFDEKAKEIRFDRKGLSQRDYLNLIKYADVDVPVDSRETFSSLVKNTKESFRTGIGTASSLGFIRQVDNRLAAKANRTFLEWVSIADQKDLTQKNMREVHAGIVSDIKSGDDPAEKVPALHLKQLIDSGELTGASLWKILEMKEKGVPAWIIMGSDEVQSLLSSGPASFKLAEPQEGIKLLEDEVLPEPVRHEDQLIYQFPEKKQAEAVRKELLKKVNESGEILELSVEEGKLKVLDKAKKKKKDEEGEIVNLSIIDGKLKVDRQ